MLRGKDRREAAAPVQKRSEGSFQGLEVLLEGGEDRRGFTGEVQAGKGFLGRGDGVFVFGGDAVTGGVGEGVGDSEDEAEGGVGDGMAAGVEVGLMMIEDGFLNGSREVPAAECGGAEFGVGGVDEGILALLEGSAAGGAHCLDAEVLVGERNGDHEAAQVMEETGGECALRVLGGDSLDKAVGEEGGGESVAVEARHGPGIRGFDAGPEAGDGESEEEVAQFADAQDGDGGADAADVAAATVESGVDKAQDVAAEDGVALDKVGEAGEADVVIGESGHEVVQHRGERG